ncbi:MAG: translocation protein TolB, partial [Cyclobacteriaceae bacterium]
DRRVWILNKQEQSFTGRQKYSFNKFQLTSAIPINVSSRLSLSPFFATTNFYELDRTLIAPGQASGNLYNTNSFMGFNAEYIFDNTLVKGLNLIQGTRAKVKFSHYESIGDNTRTFSNISMDIRNYQKIYREMVFATRFFYGRFLGNNKQNYLLGGVDNWILNKANDDGENNPLRFSNNVDNSNILFAEYLTSLRGFNYNTFYGANAMLFNAELRVPIVRIFYRGPISSNFFRNLQFIGFYDIGSAWTGNSPFATENEINTELISSGPFEVRLKNYKNPWLSSYGTGVRTMLLGYFVKFDVAWPIEDYLVRDRRYFLSLGFDF